MASEVKYGALTDPLTLSANFEIVDIKRNVGGDWETIHDHDGYELQRVSKSDDEELKLLYHVCSATPETDAPDRGATVCGYDVLDREISEPHKGHHSMTLTIHRSKDVNHVLKSKNT